jgi:hypothetical protein
MRLAAARDRIGLLGRPVPRACPRPRSSRSLSAILCANLSGQPTGHGLGGRARPQTTSAAPSAPCTVAVTAAWP